MNFVTFIAQNANACKFRNFLQTCRIIISRIIIVFRKAPKLYILILLRLGPEEIGIAMLY